MARRTVDYKLMVSDVNENAVLALLNQVRNRIPAGYQGKTSIITPEQYLMAIEGYRAWKGEETKYYDSLLWLSQRFPNAIFQWCEQYEANETGQPDYDLVFSNGRVREYYPSEFIDFLVKRYDLNFNALLIEYVGEKEDEIID